MTEHDVILKALARVFPEAKLFKIEYTPSRNGDTTRAFIAWERRRTDGSFEYITHRFCIDSSGHAYLVYGYYGFTTAALAEANVMERWSEFIGMEVG